MTSQFVGQYPFTGLRDLLTVSPALLHDGVKLGWTMERLLQTKAVGFIDGLEDLLTWKKVWKAVNGFG